MTRLRAVTQVVRLCKSQLEEAGFDVKGSVGTRTRGALIQGIAVRASRNSSGQFLISLDVAILDPSLAKPDHVVCLRGYVGRSEASHRQVWWESREVEQAASSLLSYAVPWLDERGNVTSLISIFETGIKTRQSVQEMDQRKAPNEAVNPILRNLFPNGLPQGFPFVYHHWLSLLYCYSVPPQISQGLAHAKEYSKYVPGVESEGVVSQLEAMIASQAHEKAT